MDALNHNGVKGDMLSVDVLVEQTGESRNQIYRLVRLTELVADLLDRVDTKQLAFNPAVELSYLSIKEQMAVVAAMAKYEVKPSLSQAVRLKKMSQDGKLTIIDIDRILSEQKKQLNISPPSSDRYRQFFPAGYSQQRMDEVIIGLLIQ